MSSIQPQKITVLLSKENAKNKLILHLLSSHNQIRCYENPVVNSGYNWVKYFWNPEEYLRFLLFFKEHYLVKIISISFEEWELIPKWFWNNQNFSFIIFDCDESFFDINSQNILHIKYDELVASLSHTNNRLELSSHFSSIFCDFLDINYRTFYLSNNHFNNINNAKQDIKRVIMLSEDLKSLNTFCHFLSSHPHICTYIEPINSPLFTYIEDYWTIEKFLKFLLFNNEYFKIKALGLTSEEPIKKSFWEKLPYILITIANTISSNNQFSLVKSKAISHLPLSIDYINTNLNPKDNTIYLNEELSLKICNFLDVEPFSFYIDKNINP